MEYKKRKKLIAAIAMPVIVIAALAYSFSNAGGTLPLRDDQVMIAGGAEDVLSSGEPVTSTEEKDGYMIYVDVGGAVAEPQVVCIEGGSRVFQAIEAAGGSRDDADLSAINLASVCEDGQKIYIPSSEEAEEIRSNSESAGQTGSSAAAAGGLVNINTAGSEELQTLNGVGPGIAQRILDYRTANGSFRSVEDIKNVNGIGDKTYEKLKDHIS